MPEAFSAASLFVLRMGLAVDAASNRNGVIQTMDQAEQRGIDRRFIPMVEAYVEGALAFHRAYDGAEDGGHPQQCGEASCKADAAEHGEDNEHDHSQGKANKHLRRSQFLR